VAGITVVIIIVVVGIVVFSVVSCGVVVVVLLVVSVATLLREVSKFSVAVSSGRVSTISNVVSVFAEDALASLTVGVEVVTPFKSNTSIKRNIFALYFFYKLQFSI